jgi:hypothetical protein
MPINSINERPGVAAPPDALLLLAPGCAHCPTVLEGLVRLVKEGRLGRLEVVSVAAHPEAAAAVGARSVPWTRIGPFELEGTYGPAELRQWAEHAAAGTGMGDYLAHLLEQQRLARAVAAVRESPSRLLDLVELLGSPETPMGVRIGIGAVIEEMEGTDALRSAVPALAALTSSPEPAVRADACHYLGLSGSAEAVPAVASLLDDPQADVREIAAESLALLDAGPAPT